MKIHYLYFALLVQSLPLNADVIEYSLGSNHEKPDTWDCQVGFITGINFNTNSVLCAVARSDKSSILEVSVSLAGGIEKCNKGTALISIEKNGLIKCGTSEDFTFSEVQEVLETSQQEYRDYIHTCKNGWLMTGIDVQASKFQCTKIKE